MTSEIFETAESRAIFDAPIFEPVRDVAPAEEVPKVWQVWMNAAAVSATVAIATAGTLLVTTPVRQCPVDAPVKSEVRFAYPMAVPTLTPHQRARAAKAAKRSVPRPHPTHTFEESDFV